MEVGLEKRGRLFMLHSLRSMKKLTPPRLALEEVRRRICDPKTKIVMASQDAVNALKLYVDRVLIAVKDVTGIKGEIWISDESCLSDLFNGSRDRSQDQFLYDQIGERLGILLDRANDDDHFIVRVALKLKNSESSSQSCGCQN